MAQNHVYRLRTRGSLRGSKMEFGVHLQQRTAVGSPSEMAADWRDSILPLVRAATSVEMNWEQIVVTDTADVTVGDEMYELQIPQPADGSVAGDCLPGQNAVVVSLKTGSKGRRKRGRFFLPGISETGTANGRLTGAQLTAVTALGTAILDRYGPGGAQPNYGLVIYSPPTPPFKPKAPPPIHTDTLITPVRTVDTDEVIRTQRRRAIGVGD